MTNLKKIVTTVLCMSMLVGASGVMQSTSTMTAFAATTTNQSEFSLPKGAFYASDGGYYIPTSDGGVSFVGVKNRTCTSFNVPSTVKCNENNKTYNVTQIGYPTGQHVTEAMDNLINVTVEKTLRKINASTFWYSFNLQSFSFNGSPLELTEIGDLAFRDTKINYFDFYNAKKLKTIGNYAFDETRINQVDLRNNTALESIGKFAFFGVKVANVTLPSSLDSIGDGAFQDCVNLTSVNVAGEACNLWKIGARAFKGCTALKTFTMPKSDRTVYFGSNGVGCFDLSSSHKLTMTVPNPSIGKCRGVDLNGSSTGSCNDVTSYKKGYLIVNGGYVCVSDYMTGETLGIKCGKEIGRVFPK